MQNLLIGIIYRVDIFHAVSLFLFRSRAILVLYCEDHISPNHHLCQFGLAGIPGLHISNHLTALNHRHAVTQIHNFPQLMGDNNDGLPLVPQHFQVFHQLVNFLRRQNRRGLIQNQDIHVAV